MHHADENLARAGVLPPVFTRTAAPGGLDAAWVHVTGELDFVTTPELERTLLRRAPALPRPRSLLTFA